MSDVENGLKFPLKYIRHDLRGSMRGQGKRRGGMIMEAMSAGTGVSLEFDVKATFGLTDEEAEEVKLFSQWEFNAYRKHRQAGDDHDKAAIAAWKVGDGNEN